MGYVTLSLGCCMVCCYNCFISGRLVYLYAFASYDHPYALKIKYAMTRDCQFLLEVVLWIYEHSLDCFVGLLYFLHLQVLIPSMYSADTLPILGLYLADTRPILGRHLADTWPTLDRYLADICPTLDR